MSTVVLLGDMVVGLVRKVDRGHDMDGPKWAKKKEGVKNKKKNEEKTLRVRGCQRIISSCILRLKEYKKDVKRTRLSLKDLK